MNTGWVTFTRNASKAFLKVLNRGRNFILPIQEHENIASRFLLMNLRNLHPALERNQSSSSGGRSSSPLGHLPMPLELQKQLERLKGLPTENINSLLQ
mmetsp:Transcript_16940/g.69144  ORF Transcript_16940/g.69144 Transcript_16940/m.69144 type:complete len:98 (-) Transcript_16940:1547-1840(-)